MVTRARRTVTETKESKCDFQCEVCRRSYYTEKGLEYHIERNHEE